MKTFEERQQDFEMRIRAADKILELEQKLNELKTTMRANDYECKNSNKGRI